MKNSSKYRMSLTRLRVGVLTGIRAHEQKTRQPIDIDIDLDIVVNGEMILGENIPSYSEIKRGLVELLQSKHYPLLETLAMTVLDWSLTCRGVAAARVSITKPMALGDALASVSVEGGKK